MVERFTLLTKGDRVIGFVDNKNDEHLGELSMMKLANQLSEENEQLKSEIQMLKTTIGRNEAYIKRLTETSGWHC